MLGEHELNVLDSAWEITLLYCKAENEQLLINLHFLSIVGNEVLK